MFVVLSCIVSDGFLFGECRCLAAFLTEMRLSGSVLFFGEIAPDPFGDGLRGGAYFGERQWCRELGVDGVAVLQYEMVPVAAGSVSVLPPLRVCPSPGGVEHGDVAAQAPTR